MGAISPQLATAAYEVARQVYGQQLTLTEAKATLVKEQMDVGSAQAYIGNLLHMLAGEKYTRTMNEAATNIYLRCILRDYGVEAAVTAIKSARLHRTYYAGLGNGDLKYVGRVCDDIERHITEDYSS